MPSAPVSLNLKPNQPYLNKIIFTEEFCQPEHLHPFTLTRQLQDIRVGILTIREKWEKRLGLPSFDCKEDDYKDLERSVTLEAAAEGAGYCLLIHGNVLPTNALITAVKKLRNGDMLTANGNAGIVFRFSKKEIQQQHRIRVRKAIPFQQPVDTIAYPWDIIRMNDREIRSDFALLKGRRRSQPVPSTNKVSGKANIFIEKGAKVNHCIINATTGPVYIGKDAELMEGSMVRGPFSMGTNACLKMGSKVYGATSIGPSCVAGGEIKNSVLFGYSNKAHDGYLGDSVIGEWCNLGAGTTNSNLKNNASAVKVWTPKGEMNAGTKCGMMMGDYSRTAINTSVNTGTVIGVCCNVFGAGLTPKYIPSFSWGSDGLTRYDAAKALLDIADWKQLKGAALTPAEKSILQYIHKHF